VDIGHGKAFPARVRNSTTKSRDQDVRPNRWIFVGEVGLAVLAVIEWRRRTCRLATGEMRAKSRGRLESRYQTRCRPLGSETSIAPKSPTFTPAMAAESTDKLWEMADIVRLVDEYEERRKAKES
jgi:hypothetical protein